MASNNNGRALEYCIAKTIEDTIPRLETTFNTEYQNLQSRDKEHFENLNSELQDDFKKAATSIAKWLIEESGIQNTDKVHVRRFRDSAGVDGDVTDIRVSINAKPFNLSIKHNHTAAKHQRPRSTPTQLGLQPSDPIIKKFSFNCNAIDKKFHLSADNIAPGSTTFKELKEIDPQFINACLYEPYCWEVANLLNHCGRDSAIASKYFRFLLGSIVNFYKLNVKTRVANKHVSVQHFNNIEEPESFTADFKSDSYVIVLFSNGWVFHMRLHTASSRLSEKPSLKFDTRIERPNLPELKLPF